MIDIHYGNAPKVAILVKEAAFKSREILEKHYVNPLVDLGIELEDIMLLPLSYDKKKVSVKYAQEHLADIKENLPDSVHTLLCPDSDYFKVLSKERTAEPHHGYCLPCKLDGFEHLSVILSVNYMALLYAPDLQDKLDRSFVTLANSMLQTYTPPGEGVIKEEYYPSTVAEIGDWLANLHQYKHLTCDIEGFSLKFYKCGVATITFCWNEGCGVAFNVDMQVFKHDIAAVRALLVKFFREYKGTLIYHNAGFDLKVMIYTLFMQDLADYRGLLDGLNVMTQSIHDTKLIAYLALNKCGKTSYRLKDLAQEFAGNWAQEDIKDITKIDPKDLLQYNLMDGLSTWFVYNKYTPMLLDDKQENVYFDLFIPAVKVLLQTELVGMPIDPEKVQIAKKQLQAIVRDHVLFLANNETIKSYQHERVLKLQIKENEKLKKKVRTYAEVAEMFPFNPNSNDQLRELIYDFMGYEAIDFTDTKEASTGAATLKKLLVLAKTADDEAILENVIGLSKAMKILSSFIPAFEQAQRLPDGSYRLYGNFNLGGTQSGRLSSSDPNLQNIPSGSTYAKIIKACFISGHGWLFGGADFSALEAVTEALLSRDPNKIKIYTDGYDSHCFNTFYYFRDQMPDIIDTVASINSIKKLYGKLRQKSKAPTFALQYQGSWFTIMKSAGVIKAIAQQIEQRYLDTYKVSVAWLKSFLDDAHDTGYIEGCFGLRLRTPLLKKSLKTKYKMTGMVAGERRSAGNAKTQSYGMLNTRAANAFMKLVWASQYKYDIMPCAQIHDAIYFSWTDNPAITAWINKNLIECMRWQELPELQHPTIKLNAELDIFWPCWKDAMTLPRNDMTVDEIKEAAKAHIYKLSPAGIAEAIRADELKKAA